MKVFPAEMILKICRRSKFLPECVMLRSMVTKHLRTVILLSNPEDAKILRLRSE